MEISIPNSRGNLSNFASFKGETEETKKGEMTMPAEIESMMWFGDRPWHGLGVEVLEMQTSEEALVKAGLDWEVQKKKLFISGNGDDSGPFLEVDGNFAIVRKTDEKTLGVVDPDTFHFRTGTHSNGLMISWAQRKPSTRPPDRSEAAK